MPGKKGSARKKRHFLFAGIIFLIALIIFLNLQTTREKAVKVTTEKVQKQDITSIISASGEVKPKKNINISALVAGRVVKIGVREGDEVKTGDFLLLIDPTYFEAQVDRYRATINQLKAELIKVEAQYRRDKSYYERQKALYDSALISKDQLEAARAQYEVSSASLQSLNYQIKESEAGLKSALEDLKKTTYASPIDGVVTSLRVEEGEVAIVGTMNNPGTVLMSIADLSVMEVEVEVDETDVINVRLGQEARVKIDAFPERVFKGQVTEIGSSALDKSSLGAEESRDFKVVITLENTGEHLKPGLSASADIIVAEKKQVLTVPIAALVIRETSNKSGENSAISNGQKKEMEGVFIIEAGRAKFQPVKKGIMGGMMVEIESGLTEGQEIVSGPYSALRDLKDGTLLKVEKK
ncbi:MAG TPA: efflux RND transporter periplasmic adaptor subunit [Candidatus Saccharicenans sp.]|nr:efflux RND transporter periplasmic adaptor subunit [Candidatus Saccharicenans sp.]HQM75380.1 efflux RND transporter periplasmic adaptor subunit [Candidatus Saccharicenans sp.]HQO76395.1 efflux RND transporter periplasmic adaptor subunit [Candidatus Saccharicenans sp.]